MTVSSNVTKDWTDKDWHRFSEWLEGALRQTTMKVTFLKKDGTERIMNCTLNPELTENYEKKTERTKEQNEDVCPVYDLEAKGWRSFRYDTITQVRFDIGKKD